MISEEVHYSRASGKIYLHYMNACKSIFVGFKNIIVELTILYNEGEDSLNGSWETRVGRRETRSGSRETRGGSCMGDEVVGDGVWEKKIV